VNGFDITQQHIVSLDDVLVANITFYIVCAVISVTGNICRNCSFLH